MGRHGGPARWAGTVGRHGGPARWAGTLGRHGGPARWAGTVGRHVGPARWAGTVGRHGGPARMARGLTPLAQHGSLLLGRAGPACYSTRPCRPSPFFFRPGHRPKWAARPVGQVYPGPPIPCFLPLETLSALHTS